MSNPAPSQVAPVAPGTVLAGKYRVERVIGQGGMGVVVEASHIALDDRIALKFLLPDYAANPEAAERFLHEAKAARKIKSEHVARVEEYGTLESGAPYMVMELLQGQDLAKMLETSGVLSPADAIDFILQACEAIAEAHALGIVHRDLKPSNLFVTRRADGSPLVKVLDFGISKGASQRVDSLTKSSAAMGSALYMSPEQMQQTRSADHRTDIYALGVALYELLAGKQPFYAETLPQLIAEVLTGVPTPLRQTRPDIPDGLARVIEKAYARDRGVRHQSIADFAVALAPFAPPRSQVTIERIARMAGLAVPAAGAGPRLGSAPDYPAPRVGSAPDYPAPRLGSAPDYPAPRVGSAPDYPAPRIGSAPDYPAPRIESAPEYPSPAFGVAQAVTGERTSPLPPIALATPGGVQIPSGDVAIQGDARPSPVPKRPGSDPHQIILGPYHGPVSSRAAASFAQGPTTQTALAGSRSAAGPGRTGALVAVLIAVLAIGGVAAAFALRGGPGEQGKRSPSGGSIAIPPPTQPADPTPPASVKVGSPVPTEDAVSPSASAPVAPASVQTAAPSTSPRSSAGKGAVKPPSTAKPAATAKPDIYGTSH